MTLKPLLSNFFSTKFVIAILTAHSTLGAAIWSKRYFAITETKLIYYLEQDRVVAKGEIVLSGATARVSSTRIGSRKQHYFEISHPEC